MKKIIFLLLILTITFTAYNNSYCSELQGAAPQEPAKVMGKVVETGSITKEADPMMGIPGSIQSLKVELLEGEYKDKVISVDYYLSYGTDANVELMPLKIGNKVLVGLSTDMDGNLQPFIYEIIRHNSLFILLMIFFGGILIVGGLKGLKSILSLIITIISIFVIMIPIIFKGVNPIVASILTCAFISAVTFILLDGFKKKTFTAFLGTVSGVALSGIFAWIFSILSNLSGFSEEAIYLSYIPQNISFDFRGLLFAGIVIGASGACMDVSMSIASALEALKIESPNISRVALFKAGMHIGRDIIGTMSNTLILAYVGGALNLILIFVAYDTPFIEIINKEMIAQEILRALAGSIGLVFIVPITALLASTNYSSIKAK